jgi:hypothetical protein
MFFLQVKKYYLETPTEKEQEAYLVKVTYMYHKPKV